MLISSIQLRSLRFHMLFFVILCDYLNSITILSTLIPRLGGPVSRYPFIANFVFADLERLWSVFSTVDVHLVKLAFQILDLILERPQIGLHIQVRVIMLGHWVLHQQCPLAEWGIHRIGMRRIHVYLVRWELLAAVLESEASHLLWSVVWTGRNTVVLTILLGRRTTFKSYLSAVQSWGLLSPFIVFLALSNW